MAMYVEPRLIFVRGDDNTCEMMILVSGTIAVAALAAGGEKNGIQVVFKSFTPFTHCISQINNTQIDNAKYINVIMPI